MCNIRIKFIAFLQTNFGRIFRYILNLVRAAVILVFIGQYVRFVDMKLIYNNFHNGSNAIRLENPLDGLFHFLHLFTPDQTVFYAKELFSYLKKLRYC